MIAESQMPPVQSMEAVDLHLRMIVTKLTDIVRNQESMQATLATKAELATLEAAINRKIDGNSPSAFWRKLTTMSVGIVSVAAAIGVLVAIVKYAARFL